MDRNSLKIIALCKTFSGEEFVGAMIDSIYNQVDKIVFVHSDTSWTNKKGNTVKEVVKKWKSEKDNLDKIVNLEWDCINQIEQYEYGYNWIKNNLKSNFIMLVDTDEIWDEEDLIRAKEYLISNRMYNAFTVNMYTYIKSPFYRLKNIEPCKPTIFIRNSCNSIKGVRGNKIVPRLCLKNIFMHHFTYVRKDFNSIIEKIMASTKADGLNTIDLNKWITEKWDKLPDSSITNLHTSKGFEHYWLGVKKISKEELPKVFQKNSYPIIEQYLKEI